VFIKVTVCGTLPDFWEKEAERILKNPENTEESPKDIERME